MRIVMVIVMLLMASVAWAELTTEEEEFVGQLLTNNLVNIMY